jgi:hypothetical protein
MQPSREAVTTKRNGCMIPYLTDRSARAAALLLAAWLTGPAAAQAQQSVLLHGSG